MKTRATNKNMFLVFLGPSILSFVLIHLFKYAEVNILQELTDSFLSQYTVGVNIARYSPYPQFFSAALFVNVALIPILIFYWWPIADGKNPKGIFYVLSPLKGFLFLLITAMFYLIAWSLPVNVDPLENVGRHSLRNMYTSSFLFYLMFLMPISFWSMLISGYIKTLIEIKKV
ncbi:hypothetical protein AADZ84_17390 [Colwelliaceae bacterium MEBiC 14330]|jgi:hypothetical protein